MYRTLDDGRVFVDYGPIQMSIDCRQQGVVSTQISTQVAQQVIAQLEQMVPYVERLKPLRYFKTPSPDYPWVLNKMITAVALSGCEELNTLGAVAGSFSQFAVEMGKQAGASKILINNGGDIALYNGEDSPISVGMPVNDAYTLKTTLAPELDTGGICTSGVRGRSFSKGIATFVTIFAQEASVADACATYVANCTNVEHPNILRAKAEDIDAGTDIKGQLVTVRVGDLPQEAKLQAVYNGYTVAEGLYQAGIIQGAVICVDDTVIKLPETLPITTE